MSACAAAAAGLLLLLLLLLSNGFRFCLSQGLGYERSYISWEDLKVDEQMVVGLNSRNEEKIKTSVIVVDKSGYGNSLTVQGAVDMVPDHKAQRFKIYILPGIYREKVRVPITKPYISFIGNDNQTSETLITWNDKASDRDINGFELGTYRTATVAIEADYFCATGITFENSAVAEPGGYGMQGVALRVAGDKAMFYKVRVLGAQDTLLDENGSHYYYKSHIQGNVDFIFGRSRSLYQDCVIQSTAKTYGAIAAHHRDTPYEDTGFSFVNCTIIGTGNVFLGRAWGAYSRVIYSYCEIDNIITPTGWSDWNIPPRQRTVEFGEYRCRGRGADRRGRVPWLKSFSPAEIIPFLGTNFIHGQKWLRL